MHAVRILLGPTKVESAMRSLDVAIEDAPLVAERTGIRPLDVRSGNNIGRP